MLLAVDKRETERKVIARGVALLVKFLTMWQTECADGGGDLGHTFQAVATLVCDGRTLPVVQ